MENFPSNSRNPSVAENDKPEEKRILKVVDGNVVRRKKPLGKRFNELFFGGNIVGVLEYVVQDVLLPAAKDTISDAVSQGVERLIFGESRPANRRLGSRPSAFGGGSNHVSYNRYSTPAPSRREESTRPPMSRRAQRSHDFDEIIIPTRAEAEDVLDHMYALLKKYKVVSVKDLYELVEENFHYTDEEWGWTSLQGATVTRVHNGYLLNLPKTEPID